MKSIYGLPITGRCESHSCDDEGGRCEREGRLFQIRQGSTNNDKLNDGHWEQYSCEIAEQIDRDAGFELVLIDGQ